MSKNEKGRKGKKTGLGLAIWILTFLIILIVFLVKSEEIKTNLKDTRFFERIFGKTPTFITEHVSKNHNDDLDSEKETVIELNKIKKTPAEPKKNDVVAPHKEVQKPQPEKIIEKKTVEPEKTAEKISEKAGEKVSEKKAVEAEKKTVETVSKSENTTANQSNKIAEKAVQKPAVETPKKIDTISSKVCFVAIDSDGPVIRKEVSRIVAKDSPLTNSLVSLLNGPTVTEASTGCRSLIPDGTRLISVSVKNRIATINFSEEFEFNQFGVEGYLGQLMQVVYTATNYSTVDSVQIVIEGKKKEYLGSEGVWIGSPLSRASFR